MRDEPNAADSDAEPADAEPESKPNASREGASSEGASSEGASSEGASSGGASGNTASQGPLKARFLDGLPDDPALQELAEAFEAGNYARVRAEAPRLASESEREEVRTAARELLTRIEPDPLVKYLLVLALLLLLGVTAFAYGSGHG